MAQGVSWSLELWVDVLKYSCRLAMQSAEQLIVQSASTNFRLVR